MGRRETALGAAVVVIAVAIAVRPTTTRRRPRLGDDAAARARSLREAIEAPRLPSPAVPDRSGPKAPLP